MIALQEEEGKMIDGRMTNDGIVRTVVAAI
jgi:hypothetical protein